MYSPKINPYIVVRLYSVCRELGVPMTVFANGAMERALLRAEEYMSMGEAQKVRDMIGLSSSQTIGGTKSLSAEAAGG